MLTVARTSEGFALTLLIRLLWVSLLEEQRRIELDIATKRQGCAGNFIYQVRRVEMRNSPVIHIRPLPQEQRSALYKVMKRTQ